MVLKNGNIRKVKPHPQSPKYFNLTSSEIGVNP
jgi:hypothetical protein